MYMTLVFMAAIIFPVGTIAKGIIVKADPYRVVTIGGLYGAIGCFIIVAMSVILGDGISTQMNLVIDEMSKVVAQNSQYAQVMGLGDLSPDKLEETYKLMYQSAAMTLPAIIIIWSVIISYLEFILISFVMRKRGKDVLKMTPVREFSLQRSGFFGWFVICMISFVMNQFGSIGIADTVYVNIYILFRAAFAYQGISFLAYLFHMKGLPKPVWIILTVIMLAGNIGTMILYIVGMMDAIFNFKGRFGAAR